MSFCPVYVPVGVPTFHLESAQDQFEKSVRMLRAVDERFVCPEKMLLSLDDLQHFLDGLHPDLVVFQNLTFANAAYTRDSYFGNSAFTDFIHQLQLQITKADISLNAPLSFDAKIDAGPVTVADMFKLYRFENQLCVMKMTGRELHGHLGL